MEKRNLKTQMRVLYFLKVCLLPSSLGSRCHASHFPCEKMVAWLLQWAKLTLDAKSVSFPNPSSSYFRTIFLLAGQWSDLNLLGDGVINSCPWCTAEGGKCSVALPAKEAMIHFESKWTQIQKCPCLRGDARAGPVVIGIVIMCAIVSLPFSLWLHLQY